ncbi:MAG: M56 family metallopeptidase [Bacteroidota bacterium]
MIELNEFLIKSSIVLLVFYVGYWFLLRKGTHFRLNRFYLLIGLVFSVAIPFFSFQLPANNTSEIFVTLDSIDISANGQLIEPIEKYGFIDFIQLFYFSVVFVLFFRILIQFYLLLKIFVYSKIEILGNTKIVLTEKKNAVFSFFNLVFVNKESWNSSDFQAMLKHERIHMVQKHSVDILLAEILSTVLWFNPFTWLYRKSIKENHEFLADEGVIHNGYSANHYQKVLFEQSTGLHLSLANNFNQSLTFKRLNMMKKLKSSKLAKYKVLIAVPVVVAMVIFVACSKELVNVEPAKDKKVDTEQIKKMMTISEKDTVFFVVEKMPQFPGKELGLRKYLAQNVNYPDDARINGIEGKVYVRFAVTKTGVVDHVTIARGVDSLLDNEAIRVVSTLPKWQPGEQRGTKVNVWYTVPINFSLQGSNKSDEYINSDKNTVDEIVVVTSPPDKGGTNEQVVIIDIKRDSAGISKPEYKELAENGNKVISVSEVPSNEQDFNIVEKMPEYPGGQDGLRKFLALNLKYPEKAREGSIEGRVYVKFLVTKEGAVDKVSIARGNDADLNEEAMRVVKLTSGQWTPGEQKGEKVNVWFTVPIQFSLN